MLPDTQGIPMATFTVCVHSDQASKQRSKGKGSCYIPPGAAPGPPELPPGPPSLSVDVDKGKGGLVLEKGRRPFNELRKAHLLTITA